MTPRPLPDLLTPQTCRLASRYARTLKATGAMQPDNLVPGAPARYGDALMDAILDEVHPQIEQAVGTRLLPTYSYFRIYGRGDALPRHTDRPECEVSVTVCLASSGPDWPLVVETPDGTSHVLVSPPGSGALYAGPEHPHWREPFAGDEQIQMFIHYVRAEGPHAALARDGRDRLGVSMRPAFTTSGLTDHIMVVDDVIDEAMVRRIRDEYDDSGMWGVGTVGSQNEVEPHTRMCEIVELSHPGVIGGSDERARIDKAVFDIAGTVARAYKARFPWVQLKTDSGYLLMRYPHGGFYREHADHFHEKPRTLSMSLFLNDDFEGGGLSFFGGQFTVQPRPGRAVVFPSNFLFPHQVIRVTNGTRYAIVTWFS